MPENAKAYFVCDCGKEYKHSSGLSRHKNAKKCVVQNINEIDYENESENDYEIKNLTNIVLQVVKQNKELITQNNETYKHNQELTNKLFEICKNGNNTMINNNSYNKTFNLNVFLNEECKDAMNIMDFVDSLKLQLSDLENVGKLGFVEGISSIIVKNLKALDVHKRPVHCSDSKREVMYIKDEDKWERENDDKLKLRKVIKHIAHKNSKLLPIFKEKYPDCVYSDSKKSDQYNKLIIEAMGGSGNEDYDNENKIIKRLAKEVTIDKY
jgi:predicted RNase H-like nuclease (RuvC/YqgF family)